MNRQWLNLATFFSLQLSCSSKIIFAYYRQIVFTSNFCCSTQVLVFIFAMKESSFLFTILYKLRLFQFVFAIVLSTRRTTWDETSFKLRLVNWQSYGNLSSVLVIINYRNIFSSPSKTRTKNFVRDREKWTKEEVDHFILASLSLLWSV